MLLYSCKTCKRLLCLRLFTTVFTIPCNFVQLIFGIFSLKNVSIYCAFTQKICKKDVHACATSNRPKRPVNDILRRTL